MKTHKLSDLNLDGMEQALAAEPDFDFHRIHSLLMLQIMWGQDPLHANYPDIILKAKYTGLQCDYDLALRLEGVRELVMPSIAPTLYLPEVEVNDVRQARLEGIRYEIVSHSNYELRCSCWNIALLEFRPSANSEA